MSLGTKCRRPVGESGNKVSSLLRQCMYLHVVVSKDVNVSRVAKSTCIHSWQTQGSSVHTYLCFLTISNSAFVFLASSRVCSNASAVSCRRTSTPSSLHTCIRNITTELINSKYSQALYRRQQKTGLEEWDLI